MLAKRLMQRACAIHDTTCARDRFRLSFYPSVTIDHDLDQGWRVPLPEPKRRRAGCRGAAGGVPERPAATIGQKHGLPRNKCKGARPPPALMLRNPLTA
ncbi:hypothetical protein JQ557_14110 [Bradyrhizobium sp. U87765 SZCCT0131]|uniref:hypothetical protein n=1 Tax=unclassified Bradyrhizobium TaxID=2631580 RepID=UPI001BAB9DFF|nr:MULTISPECIES: hypothetical protein [unclassified Bradyrhizobium]MBR1219134.1 hypothetical protein [Bradyrhizobium sp. U87765 SZCCT0131]MBR1261785.1 hypothetical protein [Bradyrhizobium sp. U87765 SZCCT0134]MBR1306362.1 hypothetical protein [Bradyrhizobium sp. U87765 SZCCT0110]MBR1317567.1 hypothetical protein [Bradyrhizobium sp. U87765 SZCCT0109]MBR1351269.1 hypothetical protein [Bradyrhizobium sp. U87765 SZCCT0048]